MSGARLEGIVHLVGAGPGDPGLISVKGAKLLEQAQVVVYDYLANPRLLSYCPRAEKIDVGKKAGDHTLSQEQINALLVERARSGKKVVRLKGGDPFVFGRGGEECEELAAAGEYGGDRGSGVCGNSGHASGFEFELYADHGT